MLNLAPKKGVGQVVYGHGYGYAAYGSDPYTTIPEPVDRPVGDLLDADRDPVREPAPSGKAGPKAPREKARR